VSHRHPVRNGHAKGPTTMSTRQEDSPKLVALPHDRHQTSGKELLTMAQKDTKHAAQRMAEAMRLYMEGIETNNQGFVKLALEEGGYAIEMMRDKPYPARRFMQRMRGVMVVEASEQFGDLDLTTRIDKEQS